MWGLWATPVAQPLEGLEAKVMQGVNHIYGTEPNKNSRHRGSGKLPCLAILCVLLHMVAGRPERCQILHGKKVAGDLVLGTLRGSAPAVAFPY